MVKFLPAKKAKTPEKEVISIRLDTSTLEKIDSYAYQSDLSRNEFLVQSINFALEHFDDSDKER